MYKHVANGWCHALDHTNCARWLPLHGMVELAEKHPDVQSEFKKGNFVVQKSASTWPRTKPKAHGVAVGLEKNSESLALVQCALFLLTGADCEND